MFVKTVGTKIGSALVFTALVLYANASSAACTPTPSPAVSTVAAGTTVNCSGTVTLPGPYWVGENDITFNFSGNITSNNYNGLVSIDTSRAHPWSWEAQNIKIVNRGVLNANSEFGINFGYGDQNNYTNGDFHLVNYGQIHGNQLFGPPYTVIMWSPYGTARIDNHSNAVISSSGNYGRAVSQYQRGEVNNHQNATILANGAEGAYGVTFSGPAGWVAGSGFAPGYLSSGYTESRSFTLNNAGQIVASASNATGAEAYAVFTGHAQHSTINNAASGTIRASATGSSVAHAIYYDNYSNQLADIRSPLSPYVINNSGLIEASLNSSDSSAIRVRGKDFNGMPNAGATADASNPQVIINNNDQGRIIGQIILGDGADRIHLNSGSSMSGNIQAAGGRDVLTITGNANLSATDTYDGGGNAIIGDEVHSGVAWDDRLIFQGFSGSVPQLTNWEFIDLNANTNVTLPNNTDAGRVTIDSSSTLGFPNLHTLQADVVNHGSVRLQNGVLTTATIDGDYSGAGGRITVDTNFALRQSDKLTITGDVKGNSFIEFNALSSAATAIDGDIVVVKAPNDTLGEGDFNIATSQQYVGQAKKAQFTGMPFIWRLVHDANNSRWVLRAEEVAAEVPAYSGLPSMGREMAMGDLDRLHTRLGELRNLDGNRIGFDAQPLSAWSRLYGAKFDYTATANSFAMQGARHGVKFGFDMPLKNNAHWNNYSGVFFGYDKASYKTSGEGGRYPALLGSNNRLEAWSLGAYTTFFNQSGSYVDVVAQYNQPKAYISAAGREAAVSGKAFSLSAEVAKSFDFGGDWVVEPQVQLKAAQVQWGDFNDGINQVDIKDHTYLTGRLGLRAEKRVKINQGEIKPWAYAGVLHEFSAPPSIRYAGYKFQSPHIKTAGELKVGLTADLHKNSQLYANFGMTGDFRNYFSGAGHLGLRISW